MKPSTLRAVVALLLVVLVAGCGSGGAGRSAGQTSSTAPVSAKPAPPAKLTVSVGDLSPTYMKMYTAKDAGIYARNNVDVDLQVIAGPKAVAAVVAGQLPIAVAGGGETLGAITEGADLVVLGTLSTGFSGQLWAAPNIKSAADLKGKKIAITNPGGTYDVVIREALPKMGLQPDKDVTMIATGSIENAFTALLNGAVSAAPASPGVQQQKLEAAGFHVVYDLSTVPLGANFVVMQRSYLSSHHDVAQHFIDSIVEAIKKEKTDKEFTRRVWKEHAQLDDALFEAVYPYYTKDTLEPPLPYPKPEYIAIQFAQLAQKSDKAKGFDITKALDPSLVQSAADRHLDK